MAVRTGCGFDSQSRKLNINFNFLFRSATLKNSAESARWKCLNGKQCLNARLPRYGEKVKNIYLYLPKNVCKQAQALRFSLHRRVKKNSALNKYTTLFQSFHSNFEISFSA